jgi:hypothetical protein
MPPIYDHGSFPDRTSETIKITPLPKPMTPEANKTAAAMDPRHDVPERIKNIPIEIFTGPTRRGPMSSRPRKDRHNIWAMTPTPRTSMATPTTAPTPIPTPAPGGPPTTNPMAHPLFPQAQTASPVDQSNYCLDFYHLFWHSPT